MSSDLTSRDRLPQQLRKNLRPIAILRRALSLRGLLSILQAVMPIVGIFALGWDAFELVAFYVLETIVIGLFNVPKILLARAPEPPGTTGGGAAFTAVFFVLHYGFFVALQAFLIVESFGAEGGLVSTVISREGFPSGLGAIVALEFVDFARNFLATGARDRRSPTLQMFHPYARIVVQQLVAILGGWGALALRGSTVATGYLLVLVVVRLASDLVLAPLFAELLDATPDADTRRAGPLEGTGPHVP